MSIKMDSRTNYFGFRNLRNGTDIIKMEPEEIDPRKIRIKIEQEEEEEEEESAPAFFKLPLNPETSDREKRTVYSQSHISHQNNQMRPNSQFQFYFQSPSSAFTPPINANGNSNSSQRFKVPQHLISNSNTYLNPNPNPNSNGNSNNNIKCLKTNTNMNRNNRNNNNTTTSSANSSANSNANINVISKRLKASPKETGIKMDVERWSQSSRIGMKRRRKNCRTKEEVEEEEEEDDDDESILGISDCSSDQYTPNFSPGIKGSKSQSSLSNSKSYYSSSCLPELPGPGEVKPYSCNYCTDRFYSQLGIKTHLNVQHRISATDAELHQFSRKTD